MLEIRCICVFYLLAQVSSGTGIITRSVCSGDSLQLFKNITFDSHDTVVSLYMNHDTYTLMAHWYMQNLTINSWIQPGYEGKVYLDQYGTIWIQNCTHWDEESYIIEYDRDNYLPTKYEAKINLKVAPNKNCKPKITHLDNILSASLEAEDCGIPVASPQWLEYPGLSNTSGPVINLPPEKKAGTYHVCIKGPALECAKTSSLLDYCSSYTIEENDSPALSSDVMDYINYVICFFMVTVAVVFGIICRRTLIRKKKLQMRETVQLLAIQTQMNCFESDVSKPSFSLRWRFSGRTRNNNDEALLLDVVLNPDHDLIVTDGLNKELKKFSLDGQLKSTLSFETRPDCLALTDGYLATVTFPFESVLRVIDTRDELSVVSTIPFISYCAGIGSMEDGRLIISNKESRSVYVCSKDGEVLQEIKTDSSGKTLFRKPAYVRAVDNRTICVSDTRTQEVFLIRIEVDNTYTIKKQQKLNEPRTSCVVYDTLLVAASNIKIFTLDGNEAGEVILDGVKHAHGLAFSKDDKLLAVTHRSDQDNMISVYQVRKH